jgi:hypothetical protein
VDGRAVDAQAVSVRLVQVLRTYCAGLQPAGLKDLRAGLQAGQYPWLHDELAAAIGGPDPAPASWWDGAVGEPSPSSAARPRRQILAERRQVRRSLFPRQPFPAGR